MLPIIYTISFLTSLSGLIFWFFYKSNPKMSRRMSRVFLSGFLVYLFSIVFAEGALPYKFSILFRDLLVLGLVSQLFNFFRKKKGVFAVLMAVLYGSVLTHFFGVWHHTFPQKKMVSNIPLDDNWELLVEIKNANKITDLQAVVKNFGLNYEPAFRMKNTGITDLDDYFVLNIPEERDGQIGEVKEALNNSGFVDWVEENEEIKMEPLVAKLPPKVNKKFGINDPGLAYLWGFEAMKVEQLYNLINEKKVKPQRKALIAILDTGIDATHEDLSANFKSSQSKYDRDVVGHGTHCAGIAAAVSNNGKGVASFSRNNEFVEVTSIKVLNDYGAGTQRGIINGILEAADGGADVISLSLGGRSSQSKQRAYRQAVDYANKTGAIVVVAAGNSNTNANQFAPANVRGVIAVSAVDTFLHRASFSNYITDLKMGIAAPGVKIYSSVPGDAYATYNGTSMATPYVSGLVGLMKSLKPNLTTKEAFRILKQTGEDTKNTGETGRLILPAKALKELLENRNSEVRSEK